jgi:O-antigen ligase
MLEKIKNYFPYFLPLLLIFSRAVADTTIVIISILFLYYSFKQIGWGWVKQKWFLFAIFFSAYCLTINSALSIDSAETFAYAFFFLRWPIFSMALAYWILSDLKSLKKFLISLTLLLLFIIFDTWWQFFFDQDLFGFEKFRGNRLTGPFKGNPEVGTWLAKLILLPPLLLILYDKYKLQIHQNYFTYAFFIISTIVFLTIFITGERMQLLLILASILIFFFGLISEKIFSLKKISFIINTFDFSNFNFCHHLS